MKKFMMILSVLAMVTFIAMPAFAGQPSAVAGGNTYYAVGSDFTVNGWGIGLGETHSRVYTPQQDSFVNPGYPGASAGAYTGQKVRSNAWGAGLGYVTTDAYGYAGQDSHAAVQGANYNWASGGEYSGAEYRASSGGLFVDRSSGKASTIGGTIAGATNFNRGNSNIGMAGAATGSMGYARANCTERETAVYGNGGVDHGSYANKAGGEAWTNGLANYSYQRNGNSYVAGGGFAATGGISRVTTHSNGSITAGAFSTSISSNGPVNASGGTYISNLPR